MAFSINTNNAALEALASLRTTNAQLTSTENAVSTGKKVNSAADDPAIYAISQTMDSQISALGGISTGLQVTAQVISTAQAQATSSSTLLSTLSANLTEGQASGLDAATLNQTITKTLAQIDANANGATFKGVNLLAGAVGNGVVSTSASAVQDLSGTLFTQAGSNATSSGLGLEGLQVDQSGVQIALGATPTLVEDGSASTITLSNTAFAGTTTASATNVANQATFTLTNSVTSQQAAVTGAFVLGTSAITSVSLNSATGALTSVGVGTGSGYSVAETQNSAGNNVFTVTGTAPASKETLTQSKDNNGNYVYTLATAFDANNNSTNETTLVTVDTSTDTDTNSKVDSLTAAVTNQGFGISKDATNNLSVAGGNLYTGSGTGIATGGTSVTQESGSTYALLAVNAAIGQLNQISSSLGSSADELTGLQSSVSSLSDALTTGVGALTDADLSAESAKLTSLQTKQQLAIQSLSIANSQPQSLLTLFR